MGVAERKAREFKHREQEILEVSMELFREKGLDSVTMEMIAAEAEIGKGTIYQHFKSKHEIYAHLLLKSFEAQQQEIDLIDQTLPTLEQLRQVIRIYIKCWLKEPDKHRVFHQCIHNMTIENLGPGLLAKVKRYYREKLMQHYPLFQKAIDEGLLVDLPPTYLVMVGAGLMSGVAELLAEDHLDLKLGDQEAIDPELLYQTIENVLINGLTKR